MNFVKARKHLEEKDAKEPIEKSRRDRYQRSDSARLLLQALSQQQSKTQSEEGKVTKQLLSTESPQEGKLDNPLDSRTDFRPDELPDGAFYRPKKDLRNLQTVSTIPPVQQDHGVSPSSGSKLTEFTRRAEYIGTFSVSGSDKEAREKQMESQLEQMRSARDRMAVNLIISNSEVKVVHHENNNVFMEHSLKRIWYATCDPEYCQFSFLAREPKTSAEIQYCHAFVTQNAEQAEELISIIGEAFRSADNEAKKPPTFHELIEKQVQQQQAKFRESEKEAQNALQQKLKEIATPTPFSEKAQFRMEQRRISEDVSMLVGQDSQWAKQHIDQHTVKESSMSDKSSINLPGNRRSEIPTRQSTPQSSPLKRNSVPPQAALMSNPVPSSPSLNPLSVLAIRESIESKNSNSKFKGSPVTALKNEIDRRLSIPNGDIMQQLPGVMDRDLRRDQVKPPKQQPKPMINRPLPLPPEISKSPQQSRSQLAGQQPLQQSQPLQQHSQQPPPALLRHSLDDYHLPRSSSSQIPLSSNARNRAANVVMRNSPKRRQPRPMSDIAPSSSGAVGSAADRGFSEQQLVLSNLAANFNLPTHSEAGADATYIYGPHPHDDDEGISVPHGKEERHITTRVVYPAGDGFTQCLNKSESIHPVDSVQAQIRQIHILDYPVKPGSGLVQLGSRPGSSSDQDTAGGAGAVGAGAGGNVVVPRFQNDSPLQADRLDKVSKYPGGFESLMCLDRSHIRDEDLRSASWYHAGLPREIALEILNEEEVGAFIVRDSTSHPGCYALSVRVPKYDNSTGISHYLVLRTHRGVKLKGLDKEWSTLPALVTHHTLMRELLPCTLRLPKIKGQDAASSSHIRGAGGSTSNDDGTNADSSNCGHS